MSSSLVVCPIQSALCHIEAKTFVNYNGLHPYWDCFKWFCLQINSDAKYFSCLSKESKIRYSIIFSFLKPKKINIISCIVISSHKGSMYIETPYIIVLIPNLLENFIQIKQSKTKMNQILLNTFLLVLNVITLKLKSFKSEGEHLLLPISIAHRFRKVFKATSWILRELFLGFTWSPYFCSSMWRGPQEYVTYEFVPTSPAVSCVSRSSNLDSFRDEW